MRVAILEDEPDQAELLAHWLRVAGHESHAFSEGAQLLAVLEQDRFDALLLDWNLSGMSGMAVLDQVRNRLGLQIPVLFGTVRAGEADIAAALRAGADDYLVKPIRRMELIARLETIARRTSERTRLQPIQIDVFRVDRAVRTISRGDVSVPLSAKDFDLAVLFFCNVGRLLLRHEIRNVVWGTIAASSRTLDTHVSRIRRKLDLTPQHGWQLTAIYRHGYRLEYLGSPQEGSASATPGAAQNGRASSGAAHKRHD
jgi:DNA-binding response OmpR family regulator